MKSTLILILLAAFAINVNAGVGKPERSKTVKNTVAVTPEKKEPLKVVQRKIKEYDVSPKPDHLNPFSEVVLLADLGLEADYSLNPNRIPFYLKKNEERFKLQERLPEGARIIYQKF